MSTYQLIGLAFAAVGVATLAVLGLESLRRRSLDLEDLPLSSWLIGLTRLMTGVLFLYSGFVKANDYIGFAYKLEEYFIVFGQQMPGLKGFFDFFIPWAEPMAWFISVFEIALALALLLGWQMRLTAWLTLLMMIFFTVLTGYSHFMDAVTDCGCFGDALKLKPWESFVKDIILTAMLIPLFLVRGSVRAIPSQRTAGWAVLGLFVASGFFSWYCHEHLPLIDYRPYKIGVDLRACTTLPGPEGYPKCKDWYPEFEGEEIPLFEGQVLMVVIDHVEEAPARASEQNAALARELEGSGIRMVGATASGSSDLQRWREAHQTSYPFFFLDETVLKTIIRSHPGYVLLQDGVVRGKWHHNDTPTRALLEASL
jgi:uncharacterized membrane protein YphA (DoxX/SURF4 family)